jgi:ligand-binding sensor domain-containing protein
VESGAATPPATTSGPWPPQCDSVWAGTEGGVVRWNRTAGTYVKYTAPDGLAQNTVNAVAIDDAGHPWFGTDGAGVSAFDGTNWTAYTAAEGLASDNVLAIAIDEAGHIWFGTFGGVSRFNGSTWTTYTTADGLPRNVVYAVAQDEAGHMWFGTWAVA